MAVNYSASTKNSRMSAVKTKVETGSGTAVFEIGTTGMGTILATISLPNPTFTLDADHLDWNGCPLSDTDADNTGTAAAARMKDRDGNVVISGLTVGVGSGDVQLNSTSITQHQTVTITSGVFTHAADA